MNDVTEKTDFKKSKSITGPIYPVIIDKNTGEIIDGKHRKTDDPTWPEKIVDPKDLKEKTLLRMHANYRRKVTRKETKVQLLMLASILEEEGVPREHMVTELTKITPYTKQYVRKLLPAKYKVMEKSRKEPAIKYLTTDEKLVSHPSEETRKPTPRKEEKVYVCPVCATALKLRGELLVV